MKQATHFVVQKGWKIVLLDMGISPAHILALAGLPGDLLSREGAAITLEQYFDFPTALEELAGDEELPSGQSSIDEVATRMAMSTRSLLRHLKKESASYKEILNVTRKELAQHYLVKSTISPGEISFLLGYQDSNSFIRAFKSWTGRTPGEYRRPLGSTNTPH